MRKIRKHITTIILAVLAVIAGVYAYNYHDMKQNIVYNEHLDDVAVTVNGKELTGGIAPDQACFGPEFFLTQMLPDFELKIVSRLPVNKQRNGPTGTVTVAFQGHYSRFQDMPSGL